MSVANVILEQIGGQKFVMMTGAKNFVGYPDGLHFSLPGKSGFVKNRINRVMITLTVDDLYDIEFGREWSLTYTKIEKIEGIYFDQLTTVFENATGLRTSL